MIDDGISGLLVPPHDADALAAAITRLLVDHSFADTIARQGHDIVHERFCVEGMVRSIEQIYEDGARAVRPAEVAAG
jgi:glycosyltransferase involved in cell wall biosynthesis